MNLVLLFSSVLFTLFGIYSCAVLKTSSSPSPSTNLEKSNDFTGDVGQEQGKSLPLNTEKKLNQSLDDHAGDHDGDHANDQKIKPRKGVVIPKEDNEKVPTEIHTNQSISNDRASTTVNKTEIGTNSSSKTSSVNATTSDKTLSSASDRSSPYESKSGTKTDTSSSIESSSKQENTSSSSITSNSKSSASTESTSSKSSNSMNKKPLITYSIEDDPTLLNVPRVRQLITPLTPLAESDGSVYLPSSDDFIPDRMQSKRELYIFPLVVLIFLVPMVLGVGVIILRRVRDYWSTRHYRRMDFLVDGMYNT